MADEDKFTPRNYQVELMETAVENNTIIYLPTGAGKTFIAIMVLKRLSEPLSRYSYIFFCITRFTFLCRPYSANGKISFILVNSVALVDQHAKYVRDHTVCTVGTYTGEMNLDCWRRDEWEVEFNKYQVIIMTSQILVNLINNNFIGKKSRLFLHFLFLNHKLGVSQMKYQLLMCLNKIR
jgi:endoribonuclease Dicer